MWRTSLGSVTSAGTRYRGLTANREPCVSVMAPQGVPSGVPQQRFHTDSARDVPRQRRMTSVLRMAAFGCLHVMLR